MLNWISRWKRHKDTGVFGYYDEDGVKSYDIHETFAESVAAIGYNNSTLLITAELAVTDDITTPVNLTLKFMHGGSLRIAATKTVTINGHVIAESPSVFAGDGSVVYGTSATVQFSGGMTDRWLLQDSNTFFGIDVAGDGNLAHGAGTEGYNNTFCGHEAGKAITTGQSNTFFGAAAGIATTSAQGNDFFGFATGWSNTTGIFNHFFGYSAGLFNTTGGSNVFLGSYSGANNTTGSNNIAIGNEAARYQNDGSTPLETPENSIYIGRQAYSGSNPAAGEDDITNEIVIGYQAIGAGANTVTLGNTSITDTVLRGIVKTDGFYQVDGVQVVSNRVIDARCDDAINSGDAVTDGVIDALRDCLITHGLLAAA